MYTKLRERRLFFDFIFMYKIIYGLVDINSDDMFQRSDNRSRELIIESISLQLV